MRRKFLGRGKAHKTMGASGQREVFWTTGNFLDQGNILGKWETFWKMGTSGEGKLFGKNFWAWGKLLNRGKRKTFLASGKLSRIWKLLDKETFLARGNFLERISGQGWNFLARENFLGKLFGNNFWHGEYFWTWGQGKPSWQVVSFLENGNFLTRKPSWQR